MINNIPDSAIETVIREAKIKKSLVVFGNTADICLNPKNNNFEPVLKTLCDELKNGGFEDLIVWDRHSGIKEKDQAGIEELIGRAMPANDRSAQTPGATAYKVPGAEVPKPKSVGNNMKDPAEFFTLLHTLMTSGTRPTAFIIDMSDFLFGNSSSLSEIERGWLTILSKAIRDSKVVYENGKLSSVIIIFTKNIGRIPPSFYCGNPLVKTVCLPMPTRMERELFIQRNKFMLSISHVISDHDKSFDDIVDYLDGSSLREILELFNLSNQVPEPLSFEKLFNLYKYGKKKSPWEDLSKEKLKKIEETLTKRVKGQDEAVKKVRSVIIRAFTGISGVLNSSKQKKPKGCLFFVGPTGVGKTELAKALSEFLFGDESSFIRFDMSEYNHKESDLRLIGAPPSFVGYEEGGQLTNAVKEKPFSVILFDEIEKADGKILDKFLQILEDGRLTDGKGETVSFSESVIIFTSNIGSDKANNLQENGDAKKAFLDAVESHFKNELKRPELYNRIGNNIVVFNSIKNPEFMIQIARTKLKPLFNTIKEKYKVDIEFENEKAALEAICATVDVSNGGRGIVNSLETIILDSMADFIFEEKDNFYPGAKIMIRQIKNTTYFEYELK